MHPPSEENTALARGFLAETITGDTYAAWVFLAKDIADYNLVFGGGQYHEELTSLGGRGLSGADVDVEFDEVVATTDSVAVIGTVTGTHCDSLTDIESTAHSFEIAYAWFCCVKNGRIAAIHSLPDGLGLMRQIGTDLRVLRIHQKSLQLTHNHDTHLDEPTRRIVTRIDYQNRLRASRGDG